MTKPLKPILTLSYRLLLRLNLVQYVSYSPHTYPKLLLGLVPIYIGLYHKVSGTTGSTRGPLMTQQDSKGQLPEPVVISFHFYILFMQVYNHEGNYHMQMDLLAVNNISLQLYQGIQ